MGAVMHDMQKGEACGCQGKSPSMVQKDTGGESLLSRLSARFGRVDRRTLVYVLVIIAACALAIIAVATVAQVVLTPPPAAHQCVGRR